MNELLHVLERAPLSSGDDRDRFVWLVGEAHHALANNETSSTELVSRFLALVKRRLEHTELRGSTGSAVHAIFRYWHQARPHLFVDRELDAPSYRVGSEHGGTSPDLARLAAAIEHLAGIIEGRADRTPRGAKRDTMRPAQFAFFTGQRYADPIERSLFDSLPLDDAE